MADQNSGPPEGGKLSSIVVETRPLPAATLPTPLTLTPISEEGSSPTTIGDIARLSGFPDFSQFIFDFQNQDSAPRLPTVYDRRPTSISQSPSVLNQLNPLNPQNSRFSTSSRHHSIVAGSPRQSQLTEVVSNTHTEEAPPPYTRYPEPHPRSVPQVIPTRPSPASRVLSAARGLFHQRATIEAAPEVPGIDRMNSVRLDDLRSGDGSAGEAARRKQEARQRRKEIWKRCWGKCFRGGQGPTSSEKQRKRRVRRCWIIGGVVIIVLLAVIIGVVMGTRSRHRNASGAPEGSSSSDTPALPLGNIAVRPFRAAERLSTCIAPPYQWSCKLPPDTKAPMTNATNDGFKVPEFRFTVRRRDPSDSEPESSWTPVPGNVPNITDYENLASVDGETDAGEETDFYITLITAVSSASEDIQAQINGTKRGMIKEESHMLPAAAANQPLRLFNRGLDTENYGFHIYFDKTIQFANDSSLTSNRDTGGVSAKDARYRIQWNHTRFRVTIFTKTIGKVVENTATTELDLPVDIWEDRIGGDRGARTVVAYGLSEDGAIKGQMGIAEKKGVNTETRGCFCHWSNYHDP
ncbi:hypothetical protein FN846DRAFT_637133 [Sphaerosporella brunnea]|uniref:Uncharacterized protein n=1 Tax=Sphaerosporella brunnea TaxID=1250544 RepID=A0A5J5F0K1_9PEZI|nr:hypothetical protein FN846DRAFT_637133 [Sphaerosporella brunnea]